MSSFFLMKKDPKPSEHSPSAKSPENAPEVKLLPKDKVFKLYPKKDPGPKVGAADSAVRGEPAAAADVLTDLGETIGNDYSIKCVPKSTNVVQDSKEEVDNGNQIDTNKPDVRTSFDLLSPRLPEPPHGSIQKYSTTGTT